MDIQPSSVSSFSTTPTDMQDKSEEMVNTDIKFTWAKTKMELGFCLRFVGQEKEQDKTASFMFSKI